MDIEIMTAIIIFWFSVVLMLCGIADQLYKLRKTIEKINSCAIYKEKINYNTASISTNEHVLHRLNSDILTLNNKIDMLNETIKHIENEIRLQEKQL